MKNEAGNDLDVAMLLRRIKLCLSEGSPCTDEHVAMAELIVRELCRGVTAFLPEVVS